MHNLWERSRVNPCDHLGTTSSYDTINLAFREREWLCVPFYSWPCASGISSGCTQEQDEVSRVGAFKRSVLHFIDLLLIPSRSSRRKPCGVFLCASKSLSPVARYAAAPILPWISFCAHADACSNDEWRYKAILHLATQLQRGARIYSESASPKHLSTRRGMNIRGWWSRAIDHLHHSSRTRLIDWNSMYAYSCLARLARLQIQYATIWMNLCLAIFMTSTQACMDFLQF